MSPDDRQSGLGALIGAFVLCVASLALVVWILAMSWGGHALFADTSSDAPEPGADIATRTRSAP